MTAGASAGAPSYELRPVEPRRVPVWAVSAVFWAVAVGLIVLRHSGLADVVWVTTFGLIFASIAIEALPFILLGAIVSAALAAYVPDRAFARIGRLPRWLQVPGATAAAVAFPVCECGSVPVARRLIARGVDPVAGVVFMLAAPVLNPVVLGSTWVAYGGGSRGAEMVGGRMTLGLATSVLAGLVLGRGKQGLLRDRAGEADVHGHRVGGAPAFVEHLASDFLFMGRFLVLGAALAALLQTLVPQGVITGIAGVPVLGTLVLMAMAFMLSLCSEADAFVAASFVAFPLSAQLAFLTIGPIADTKLAVLYGATFRGRFVVRLVAVAVPSCLIGSLLFGAVTA